MLTSQVNVGKTEVNLGSELNVERLFKFYKASREQPFVTKYNYNEADD